MPGRFQQVYGKREACNLQKHETSVEDKINQLYLNEPRKQPSCFALCWLVNIGPYNGLL